MEFAVAKRSKNRKKRRHVKKRRRDQLKLEVKTFKRTRVVTERTNILLTTEKLTASTMQADSFWKNYSVAQEWQKRHSVTWWRSRCFALEYENQILRDKIRSLVSQDTVQNSSTSQKQEYHRHREDEEQYMEEEQDSKSKSEDLEFHVNEDMMNFLEQSIRHKMELKKQRESEDLAAAQQEKDQNVGIEGGAVWMQARNKNAKLLYGGASATILAMETALQTTVDRHKDRAKPQYWPVIPLKP